MNCRLRSLMAAQTVATQVPRVERRDHSSGLGQLSLAQESLWFALQLEGLTPAYNNSIIIRIYGALDVQALNHAISFLVERHDSLRRFDRKCITYAQSLIQRPVCGTT
jgi:hypothetical protein